MTTGLPGAAELADLIRPHVGTVTGVRPTKDGNNSALTVFVDSDAGPFFVKAVPNRPGGRRDSLLREGRINPYVQPISPAVRWHARDDRLIAYGWEVVHGRAADFTPGSADLPRVVDLLGRIAATPRPTIADDWHETRWDRFAASPGDPDMHFRGDALLYTDVNPHNFLIGDDDAWVVDWAWPTRGAAFIDPACLILQLIAAGHTPEAAENRVAECPSWTGADPKAIDAFILADIGMHRFHADRLPGEQWISDMLNASLTWADHRGINPPDSTFPPPVA